MARCSLRAAAARRATAHFLREGQTATEAGALEWLCCSAGAAGGWWTRLALELNALAW